MNEAVQIIAQTLDELTDTYRQLITVGTDKREAILSNQTDAVAAITNRESKLIQTVAELDKRRLLAVGKYVAGLGIVSTGSFRMEQLVKMVHRAEEKQLLRTACDELFAALTELKEINDFNQQMIKLNLEYISHSIDLIAGPSEDDATYHGSLQSGGFKRFSQFDTRA
ncbi:flagellar protein FlgN [Paenibacillus abyssi]|uniref:Flagellar biosynthesis protein FlgN n=1 Tax=Paenibacillus abyssi TaxID=1340531 RepID=A0A917CNR9_9BACL|nr:flagellar protein FlgN [Paenibacillus abyssi]GGF91545.1 hypothetical protein GCM10010916_06050 [Paenibacillus abyssi]